MLKGNRLKYVFTASAFFVVCFLSGVYVLINRKKQPLSSATTLLAQHAPLICTKKKIEQTLHFFKHVCKVEIDSSEEESIRIKMDKATASANLRSFRNSKENALWIEGASYLPDKRAVLDKKAFVYLISREELKKSSSLFLIGLELAETEENTREKAQEKVKFSDLESLVIYDVDHRALELLFELGDFRALCYLQIVRGSAPNLKFIEAVNAPYLESLFLTKISGVAELDAEAFTKFKRLRGLGVIRSDSSCVRDELGLAKLLSKMTWKIALDWSTFFEIAKGLASLRDKEKDATEADTKKKNDAQAVKTQELIIARMEGSSAKFSEEQMKEFKEAWSISTSSVKMYSDRYPEALSADEEKVKEMLRSLPIQSEKYIYHVVKSDRQKNQEVVKMSMS